jgi:hypothetical protein
MEKVVKGAKYQKRPSASYFYNEMNVPVGFEVEYRPRKGGKMIKHSLQLRKNGTPYWKAEEKLPKRDLRKRENLGKQLKEDLLRKDLLGKEELKFKVEALVDEVPPNLAKRVESSLAVAGDKWQRPLVYKY